LAALGAIPVEVLMRWAALGLGLLWLGATPLAADTYIPVLTYHDIVSQKNGDTFAITAAELRRQLDYLAHAGYHPISLRALERAGDGKEALPAKPVLLTFDDGYKSYYDIAFPLLRERGFPSVISLVTSWTDQRSEPEYTSAQFMSWDELRRLARSPLVEVLSHTDDLHRNVVANPFGARMPAVTTRLYDPKSGTYESEAAHRARIRADLARSVARIKQELGMAPLGITWPYGRYDGPALEVAAELGMRVYLTLDDEPTRLAGLPRVNRAIFRDYRSLADLGDALTFRAYRRREQRFVSFDLGVFAEKDPVEQRRLIFEMGERAELLQINTVLLRPFTRDAKRAYFHTDAMPVAADVLSQIAFQLTGRAAVRYLILRIPAGIDARAYADLVRLNWFTGIVIEGAADKDEFGRTAALFRKFKPALSVGAPGDNSPTGAAVSFLLFDVAAGVTPESVESVVAEALKRSSRPLFLLERQAATSTDALRADMTALRTAGAIHYGYGPDDFTHNVPEFLRIVRPLAEYAIPPPRK
jgi:peptidoglycan/xylan/chitin deacetylase (PgdA/CDA1 family)